MFPGQAEYDGRNSPNNIPFGFDEWSSWANWPLDVKWLWFAIEAILEGLLGKEMIVTPKVNELTIDGAVPSPDVLLSFCSSQLCTSKPTKSRRQLWNHWFQSVSFPSFLWICSLVKWLDAVSAFMLRRMWCGDLRERQIVEQCERNHWHTFGASK